MGSSVQTAAGLKNPTTSRLKNGGSAAIAARQFSVKVESIFEDSPISLSKWLPALWLLVNCKNGISSHELGARLGVTQKTAWFMLQRLRLALKALTWAPS